MAEEVVARSVGLHLRCSTGEFTMKCQLTCYARKLFCHPVLLLLLSVGTGGVKVTVTATVVDTNGTPYANGVVSAHLLTPTGSSFRSVSRASATSVGFFSMSIPANTYIFTVCAVANLLGISTADVPAGSPRPQQVCFSSFPIAVSGSSQDISVQLKSCAKILGPNITQMQVDGVLNVRTFGALGDGVSDDSTAIQAAVNAAFVGGGTVYFPNTQTSGPTTYV